MTSAYAYTPAIWPPVAAAIFLAALGLYAWRRRNVPAALPLLAGTLVGVVWLPGIALEAAGIAPATKIAWFQFQAVWHLPAVTTSVCFALEYTYPGRWLTRRNLTLLSIPSLLLLLAILINPQLVWDGFPLGPDGNVLIQYAAGGRVALVYGMGLILINVAAFLWLFIRSSQHRWPVALMLLGQIAGRGLFLLDVAYLAAPTPVDPTVAGILLVWTMHAIALFGFRIFGPLPAARQTVIEQMHAGVVVFDARWQVVSLNPAAERILGVRAGPARGKTWQQLAPSGGALPDVSTDQTDETSEAPDKTFGSGANARHYAPALSALKDFRGLLVGHLLMLRDVTEQRRAQELLVEHQRSLAMLHERERLARELHDSIGQVLGYASVQVEAARLLVDKGQTPVVQAQLTRLASVLQDAHADVRQQILDLRAAPSPQQPFFAAVQHYLVGFTSNYNVATELTLAEGLGEDAFPPGDQMQLYRILQEALANARKHSGARRVQVTFEAINGAARMSIEDDGCGFDLDRAAGADGSHLGLNLMAERAAELGGSLHFESAPGEGTRVVVEVPRKESDDASASRR